MNELELGFKVINNKEQYDNYYCVSTAGTVVSPSYVDRAGKLRKMKVLKPQVRGKGYLCVGLLKCGVQTRVSVHRLVAETFIPNPHNKPEVNHIDGDKTNNCVNNLEWVTTSENAIHAFETGLREPKDQVGEKNTMAKLTKENVLSIRKSTKKVETLANKFGVSKSAIYKIKQGKRWSNC